MRRSRIAILAVAAALFSPGQWLSAEEGLNVEPQDNRSLMDSADPLSTSHLIPNGTNGRGLLTSNESKKDARISQPILEPVDTCGGSDCGAPCGDSCSLIAGGQATFLWPNFNRTPSSVTVIDGLNQNSGFFSTNDSSIDNNMIVAPRIWLGVQGPRWGLVARYWNASVWDDNFSPHFPLATGIAGVSSDRFSAYLFDFEAQRLICGRCWDHRLSFGVRYGGVNLDSDVTASNVWLLSAATASAFQGTQFYGTGITFGSFSTRPIGSSCWSLYAAPRFSFLWGQGQGIAQTSAFATDQLGTAASVNGAIARGDESLFIAEFQWGVQWERQLVWSPARAFIRFGGEYQYWDTAENFRATAGSFAIVPTMASSALASSNGGLLFDMIGFTFGAGIIY
jgi:hypothetical protein